MIMDEPTAALAVAEQRKVLELCHTLRDQNVPVIIISHNLMDVFAVADRIVVMRRARKVAELVAEETDSDEVVALMTGSKAGEF
jgi:simple sugar transport system ATP-binding protein